MTEQEAKLILDVRISRFDHAEDVNEALEIAKQALEEIQRYRGIGTVEEIKTVKKYIELKKRCGTPSNTIDLCAEYAAIGTVEECREAVEKQKPKAGIVTAGKSYPIMCPSCGHKMEFAYHHCIFCGQNLIYYGKTEK